MYRIGQVAKLANVTTDTIRFYEKQGLMDHDRRTEGVIASIQKKIYSDYVLSAMRKSLVLHWMLLLNSFRFVLILLITLVSSRSISLMQDLKKLNCV